MHKKIPNIFTFISSFKKEEILALDKKIGIIFRNYEKKMDKNMLFELKKFCKLNNRKVYLANNIKLAINLNYDGAYIPAFNGDLSVQKFNKKKEFILLGSAHNIYEIRTKESQGVNVIFLSPLFKTKKETSGLGVLKFNLLSKLSNKKIIALGGINKKNFNMLKITNTYGFSGISYFKGNI